MKKFISILVLLAISTNMVLLVPLFHLRQQRIKRNMRSVKYSGKTNGEFEILEFSLTGASKARWLETKDNMEFRYGGKLYDVYRVDTIGQKLRFYVKHDRKEQKLIAGFQNLLHRTTKNDKDQATINLLNFVTHLFPPASWQSGHFLKSIKVRLAEINKQWAPVYPSVPTPPPRQG